MNGLDSFLGNQKLIDRLKRDIGSGHISHAYIIEGGEGCGKRTLAKLICSAMSCNSDDRPCMKCISCDKISRDQSPDVVMVEAEKDRVQLGVDVIRRLRDDAVYAPTDLVRKFYIITDADSMNVQAQNSLLKILEEPPSHVMFLLLSKNADELLPTVRSRAPILRVESLPERIIESALTEKSESAKTLAANNPDAFRAAVKLSRGSFGRALQLTDEKSAAGCLELYKKAERYIELLTVRRNASDELAFYEYASGLVNSKQRSELSDIYALLADAARDLVNAKLTSEPSPVFYASADKVREVASGFAIGTLIKLTDIFTNAQRDLARNVNVHLSQVRTASAAASAGKVK